MIFILTPGRCVLYTKNTRKRQTQKQRQRERETQRKRNRKRQRETKRQRARKRLQEKETEKMPVDLGCDADHVFVFNTELWELRVYCIAAAWLASIH